MTFNLDHRLQVYMYAFMYVDTETMAEEEYFPSTKHLFQTTKMSALVPIPKKMAWV